MVPSKIRYHLIVLTVTYGEIIQDLPLPDRGEHEYRIESLSENGMLISSGNRELFYYPWSRQYLTEQE